MRAAAALLVVPALLAAAPAADGTAIDGIWGVSSGDAVACSGAHVMVLREGRYSKALLDFGTTRGPRDAVIGTSRYGFDGRRLVVEPSLSLAQPEPRQVFQWDPVGRVLLRQEPAPALAWRRCPDRPLRPLQE